MTPNSRDSAPARYIMIGGFLGAGKTTAVARLARRLTDQGKRVGLISNDQSSGLVDTALLRSKGFPVEEIPGGCFCCRFNSLVEAADKLDRSTRPDVFIAEPVGSCTDLVATVSYPLRRIYGEAYRVQWAGGGVEFHPSHGDWVRLLRRSGFAVEALHEVFAPADRADHPFYEIVSPQWASRWPAEELWVARRA